MSNFSPEQRIERAFHRVAYVLRSIWEEDGVSYDTRLLDEPHVNPNTETKEFALRDPDGYYVMISALAAA